MTAKFVHPEDAMRAKILGELQCTYCTHLSPEHIWCEFFDPRTDPHGNLRAHYCEQFQHTPIAYSNRSHD